MIVIYLVLIGVSQVDSSYQIIVSYNLLNTNFYLYFDIIIFRGYCLIPCLLYIVIR